MNHKELYASIVEENRTLFEELFSQQEPLKEDSYRVLPDPFAEDKYRAIPNPDDVNKYRVPVSKQTYDPIWGKKLAVG